MSKTVLVTGAAGGMGTAICKKLVSEGCRGFAVFSLPFRRGFAAFFDGAATVAADLSFPSRLPIARISP